MGTVVLYIYFVSKNIMVLLRAGKLSLIGGFDGDFDAFCDRCDHVGWGWGSKNSKYHAYFQTIFANSLKMDVKIENSWKGLLNEEFSKPYFKQLVNFVKQEYQSQTVFPKGPEIFNAFWHCPVDQVKVVILGQDPYHGPGQAHGLSFSVREGVPFPPSLLNIFKEINRDIGKPMPSNGDLTPWADQGVLLLNATLTVRAHQAGSHQQKGWEEFTDSVIHRLALERENIVFMLWGSYAQKKGAFISDEKHLKLLAPHPSPLSAHRGFLGCGHFSKANSYLKSKGIEEIKW